MCIQAFRCCLSQTPLFSKTLYAHYTTRKLIPARDPHTPRAPNDACMLAFGPKIFFKLRNLPLSMSIFWTRPMLVSSGPFIGDRSGSASPITSIPDDSSTFTEHSMGLKLCLNKRGRLTEVGVSGTDITGLIGEIFGLDIVLVVECLCLVCFGVDCSDTGLDVI